MKWILLLGIWVVWAVILGMRWGMSQAPARVPLTFVTGQRLQRVELLPGPELPRVATWHLIRRAKASSPMPKNIFAPLPNTQRGGRARLRRAGPLPAKGRAPRGGASPSPSPAATAVYVPPPGPPVPPPPSPEEIAAQQARLQRELAAQQARQVMGQYRYLGYLMQHGEPSGFLGKGHDLYIVRVGDIVEGNIQVATIDGPVLTLRDSASTVERSLLLTSSGE